MPDRETGYQDTGNQNTGDLVPGPSWSDIASWYNQLLLDGSGPHQTAAACLIGLANPAGDERVLDLACGQGFASRAVLAAGARQVVGVDSSPEMIAHAIGNGVPDPVDGNAPLSYVVADGQTLDGIDDESFDGVCCQLGLMDIPDLSATLAAVHRVLKPSGWFVFVISHPCFLAPRAVPVMAEVADEDRPLPAIMVHTYLTEQFWRSKNPEGVRRAGAYHRTVSTYVNELLASGFAIERLEEPRANQVLADRSPVYGEVPIFLAARVRKLP
jgi:ubiquinone/menaquinone biosynthesis C-methylase UbiE